MAYKNPKRASPTDGHAPSECTVRVDIDVDRGAFDRIQPPPMAETGSDLVLGNAPGTPIARLKVIEAQHVNAAAWRKHDPEAVDVPGTVVVVQDMKEPTVEHGVELFVEVGQLESVPNEEPGRQASVASFALRDGDRCRSRVDAGDLVAEASCHESMLSGPTADVEHPTSQNAPLGKFQETRLRSADVPGGCAGIGRIEVLVPPASRARHILECPRVVAHARCVSRLARW